MINETTMYSLMGKESLGVGALAAHLAAFPAEADGLAFTLAGKPITRQTFGHKWRPAVEDGGVANRDRVPRRCGTTTRACSFATARA